LTDFSELGLPKVLVANIADQGLNEATPIQVKAIPLALEKRDVLGLAQTGTGKTAAFGLPIISHIITDHEGRPGPKSIRALILAPTRELAKQIIENLRAYVGRCAPMKMGLVVGGSSISAQITRLERGTDILVATPGRLIDLMDRRAISLDKTKFLVLDEADQMLDLGFIHALRRIATELPSERQTMLFSATMPKHMEELAKSYLTDPARVQVSPPGKAADKITQSVHFVTKEFKTDLLIECLDEHKSERSIVFMRTKHGAEKMMKLLANKGFAVDSVHGNKSQGQRTRAIDAFRKGEIKVLVATDVAARGLDIPDVKFVYNYELPNVPDNYVHRIGRTARAGADGAAIAFCAPEEAGELKDIQKTMGMEIPIASGFAWQGTSPTPERKGRKFGGKGRGRGNSGRARGDRFEDVRPNEGRFSEGGPSKARSNEGGAKGERKSDGRKSSNGTAKFGAKPNRGNADARGKGGKPTGKPNRKGPRRNAA
jgi:ATP-dependent RNA helicase RhlE